MRLRCSQFRRCRRFSRLFTHRCWIGGGAHATRCALSRKRRGKKRQKWNKWRNKNVEPDWPRVRGWEERTRVHLVADTPTNSTLSSHDYLYTLRPPPPPAPLFSSVARVAQAPGSAASHLLRCPRSDQILPPSRYVGCNNSPFDIWCVRAFVLWPLAPRLFAWAPIGHLPVHIHHHLPNSINSTRILRVY